MSAQKIVEVALSQVGYLEKASASNLDNFTANAGSGNYNKFARDIWPALQAQPWCDIFVSWCAEQAGETSAVGKYAYCPSHVQFFKGRGQWYSRGIVPQAGDIIFFGYSGEAAHVGIVERATASTVYTVEGNTSGASGLIANGGGVCRKAYAISSSYILGYGRPGYGAESTPSPAPAAAEVKTEERYSPWRRWQNGSTTETVYKDSDLTQYGGYLDPGDTALCMCRYGGSYMVTYEIDDEPGNWKVGWVGYDGGVS